MAVYYIITLRVILSHHILLGLKQLFYTSFFLSTEKYLQPAMGSSQTIHQNVRETFKDEEKILEYWLSHRIKVTFYMYSIRKPNFGSLA